MATKKQVKRSYKAILKQVGLTPIDIPLLFPTEWKRKVGRNFGSVWGRANWNDDKSKRIIGLGLIHVSALKDIKETIWHELGHHLFMSKPHWWVECYGEKMSGNGHGENRYSTRYAHSPADLPSRAKLLKLSKKAAKKLKESL